MNRFCSVLTCAAMYVYIYIYITVCQRSQKYMQLHKPQTSANDDWQGQNQCKSIQTQFESIMQGKYRLQCYNQLWPTTVIRVIHIRQALKNKQNNNKKSSCSWTYSVYPWGTKNIFVTCFTTSYLTDRHTQIASRINLFDIV